MLPRNWRWSYLEEDNGSEGDKGTGEGGKPPEGDVKPSEEIRLLTTAVGQIAQGLAELKTNQDKLTELIEHVKPKEEAKPKFKSLEERIGDMDPEQMSNTDLLKVITETFADKLEERLGEIKTSMEGRITEVSTAFHSKNAQEQFKELSGTNPDIMEWIPEVKQVLNETPGLSLARALTIARQENPKKNSEMTKKYSKEPEKKKGYLSLLPTSSRGEEGTGKMKPREAAEKAFDDVMADLDGILARDQKLY